MPSDAPTTARRRAPRQGTRRRAVLFPLTIAALILLGFCIMLYPMAASWFSSVLQQGQSDRYVHSIEALGPEDRLAQLHAAQDYNASLADGSRIVDPFSAIQEHTTRTDDPYWSLLDPSDDGVMARIRVPSIDLNLPIYHGTGGDVLKQGAGHLQGTALPVGGEGTHSVLTGHRGLPQATLFTHLDQLQRGDLIEIDVLGETLVYRVTTNVVVLPTDTQSLRPQAGKDLLTLVTCTPIGVNSHRILVTAERVDPAPPDAGQPVEAVGFPWWMLILGTVVVADVVYVVLATRRRRHSAEPDAPDGTVTDQ